MVFPADTKKEETLKYLTKPTDPSDENCKVLPSSKINSKKVLEGKKFKKTMYEKKDVTLLGIYLFFQKQFSPFFVLDLLHYVLMLFYLLCLKEFFIYF